MPTFVFPIRNENENIMPLYRNDKEKIEMATIPNYTGDDELMKKLHAAYVDIHQRYFAENKDATITIKHPKMKTGRLKGRSQESWPFVGVVRTDLGDERLRYCKSAVQLAGGLWKFEPQNFVMTKQTERFGLNDIDMILFLMVAFSPLKRGVITMVDERKDYEKKTAERGRSVYVAYHIFDESGDLHADQEKLVKVCQAWGIQVVGKYPDQLKNELADLVELSEKQKNQDYGYEAFKRALTDQDDNFEAKVLVNKTLERKVIWYNPKEYIVRYKNTEPFVRIPPQNADSWKKYLIEFLVANPTKAEELAKANSEEKIQPLAGKDPSYFTPKVAVPENPTKEFFEGLDFREQLRPLYVLAKGLTYEEARLVSRKVALNGCIQFFITEGKKLPIG